MIELNICGLPSPDAPYNCVQISEKHKQQGTTRTHHACGGEQVRPIPWSLDESPAGP